MRRPLIVLLFALPLFAAEPTMQDLSWMHGHWAGKVNGVEMEEVWLEPRGGLMTGMHRDVREGKGASFEFLRIVSLDSGLAYLAQPQGQPPTAFRLAESKPNRVVFANPEHDFPRRIIYWLQDSKLCARVEGPAGTRGEEWCWTKKE
jgi:hypothetical protein